MISDYFSRNLQAKVLLVTSIIISIMVVTFFIFDYINDKKELYNRMVLHVKENAYSIRSGVENANDTQQIWKVLDDFGENMDENAHDDNSREHNHGIPHHEIHFVDIDRRVIASTKHNLAGRIIDSALGHKESGLVSVINDDDEYTIELMEHLDVKVLAISLPVRKDGEIVGALHYAEPYSKFEELIHMALLRHSAFALFLIISLSLAINYTLKRIVTNPIQDLSSAMDALRRGERSEGLDISNKDEIGMLAKSFSRMAQVLKEREEEVGKYTTSLEEMVKERTDRLEESHAQLLHSEKLSSMGKLAGYLAHEINNPIGIIVSRAECILMDAEDEGYSEQILNDIKVIRKHSHRIASITNNMLAFTRKSSIHFGPTNVNKVIDDTLLFLEKRFINNQITVKKEIDYTSPSIYGNANRIQQILLNIFNNARDAMPDGGEITIVSRQEGNMIKVSISDSGEGISNENLKNIFEPFFTTKAVGEGTGLGLSVADGIMKEHKGKLNVYSKVGEGTTFEILLPVIKEDATEVIT